MKALYTFAIAGLMLLASCNSEPSLQKYFVEKTENKNFLAVDVSPTIFNIDKTKLTADESQAMETFEKMNILAFQLNETNKAEYESEVLKVKAILKDEKYQELMHFSSGKGGASVSFVGDENNVDEFILYGNKEDAGFAVVRILGKDMNPNSIMTMMSLLKDSKMDMEQLKPLQEMFQKNM